MPDQDVRQVLLRLLTDDDFYNQFLKDPAAALSKYSLSPEEREALLRRDRSLDKYLLPSPTEVAEFKISFIVTITIKHDWFNVATMRPIEELPPDVLAQASQLARRVLDARDAEQVEMLITLLRLLDRRSG